MLSWPSSKKTLVVQARNDLAASGALSSVNKRGPERQHAHKQYLCIVTRPVLRSTPPHTARAKARLPMSLALQT